ncbi:hypothetical protein CVT24_001349 [Panaeolus cyanescens]|uniref:F-box domain-containing protein n=1 Tax=Panaeolus cyanescens TaxID=181874 RepID=A0A409YFV0_9AGAR|nr:hypothetical protein CVT24_001349 [Panaeolus cyanescens]
MSTTSGYPHQQCDSVFPTELFIEIIKFLGDDYRYTVPGKPSTSPPHTSLQVLSSCALTCKFFASLCRPYIFQRIVLGRPMEESNKDNIVAIAVYSKRMSSLLSILGENSALGPLVQELHVCVSDIIDPINSEFDGDQVRKCGSILQLLPNLKALEMYFPSQDRCTSPSWTRFVADLASKCIAKGSLERLNIDLQAYGPCTDLEKHLSCSTLHSLQLHRYDMRHYELTLPTAHIQSLSHLTLDDILLGSELFLWRFPNLEELVLKNTRIPRNDTMSKEGKGSLKLKSLELSNTAIHIVHSLYKKANTSSFVALQSFTYLTDGLHNCHSDFPILRDFLLNASNLKTLNLTFSPRITLTNAPVTFNPIAELAKGLVNSLRVLSSLVSLLRRVQGQNKLQHLTVGISYALNPRDTPPRLETINEFVKASSTSFTTMNELFSRPKAFPQLHKVNTSVHWFLDLDTIYYNGDLWFIDDGRQRFQVLLYEALRNSEIKKIRPVNNPATNNNIPRTPVNDVIKFRGSALCIPIVVVGLKGKVVNVGVGELHAMPVDNVRAIGSGDPTGTRIILHTTGPDLEEWALWHKS